MWLPSLSLMGGGSPGSSVPRMEGRHSNQQRESHAAKDAVSWLGLERRLTAFFLATAPHMVVRKPHGLHHGPREGQRPGSSRVPPEDILVVLISRACNNIPQGSVTDRIILHDVWQQSSTKWVIWLQGITDTKILLYAKPHFVCAYISFLNCLIKDPRTEMMGKR